jgi:hypothetical protein
MVQYVLLPYHAEAMQSAVNPTSGVWGGGGGGAPHKDQEYGNLRQTDFAQTSA